MFEEYNKEYQETIDDEVQAFKEWRLSLIADVAKKMSERKVFSSLPIEATVEISPEDTVEVTPEITPEATVEPLDRVLQIFYKEVSDMSKSPQGIKRRAKSSYNITINSKKYTLPFHNGDRGYPCYLLDAAIDRTLLGLLWEIYEHSPNCYRGIMNRIRNSQGRYIYTGNVTAINWMIGQIKSSPLAATM